MTTSDAHFRLCNACKKPIGFSTVYYECSVSTCTRKRTGMVFCTVTCWETHVPVLRHRDAWAIETKSPTREQWAKEQAEENKPAPRVITSPQSANSTSVFGDDLNDAVPDDILIVASKLKAYIKARSGMNTSDGVMVALSDRVRTLCDEAIREAGRDDRKTVMDRDFKKL